LFRDCNKGQGGNDAFVIDGWDGWNKSDRLWDHVGNYIHCFAHQLQLVIVAVAKKNDHASDFFDMISLLLSVAGASCKRKDMIWEKQ
jgi:hypothetical protein